MAIQSGTAIVKLVTSGDTVILKGKSGAEMMFTLTNISAPIKEEPFAFESREFLRNLLIGKAVQFRIDHSSATRHFGQLFIQNPVQGETSVARIVLQAGWAKAKTVDPKRATVEQEELAEIESAARSQGLGVWNDSFQPRIVYSNFDRDARKFLLEYKDKPIPTIIEQVRDGSSFRLLLLLNENGKQVHQYINATLSGVKCPTYRKDVPNQPDVVEPFSEEAKQYVETRLLQKNVKVLVESVSGQGTGITFFVTILHPVGNISEFLLSEGLAKILDWNLSVVKNPKAYRDAEQVAKAKKLRLWREFEKKTQTTSNVFLASVIRIVGPDTLIVEPVSSPGTERKVTLASIRGPKRQKNEQGIDVGYYLDAVEFLRKRLIGSKVTVKIDFIKPAEGEYERRECATIIKNEKNISELLVQQGLVGVVKHKKDDHSRSSAYDSLLSAEEEAMKQEKGIHSSKDVPVHRVVDVSVNAAKAKTHLTQLQRHETVKGVVEFVSSGSRFKIFIPSQHCRLTFVLSGVRTPKAAGNNQKAEPFGEEAAKFSSRLVLQRDVDIKVENIDKVGGFIGSLFVTVSGKQSNLAVLLLEEGLSTIHEYSASQTSNSNQLFQAVETAKRLRKNIWTDYQEQEVEEVTAAVEEVKVDEKPSLFEIVISEIGTDGKLFVQKAGPGLKQLESMVSQFSAFHNSAGQQVIAPFTPKAGDYCSAQFSEDKQWYRAKVQKVNGVNSYTIVFIDYGNSETVPGSRLRPLAPQFAVSKLSAQAVECTLAYIDLASVESEYSNEAYEALVSLVQGRQLAAFTVGKPQNNVHSLVIYAKSSTGIQSVNEELVKTGLASVTRAFAKKYDIEERQKAKMFPRGNQTETKSELGKLMDAQDEAKRKRLNIWQYGDFTQDDD